MLVQGCSLDEPVLFQPELEVSSQGCALHLDIPGAGEGSKAKGKKIHFRLCEQ